MPFSCTDCDPARNLIIVKDSPIMNEFTINYILQLSPSLNNVTHESTYCEYLIIKSLSTKTNVCEYYKYKYLHSANVFCAIFICYYIKVLIELFLYFDCEFKPNMSIYSTIVSLSYEMKHKMLNTADEERPYKRSECEKTFLILLMHTDEKPHKCNELYHLYFDICRYCCTEMKLLYKLNYSLLKSNICLQSAFKSSLYKTKYNTEDRQYVRTKCDRDFSIIKCMSDICTTIFIKVTNTKYYHPVECIPYNCIKAQIINEYIVFLILLIHTEEKPYKCNEMYHLYINVCCYCIAEMIMLCNSNHSLLKYNLCLHIAIKSSLNKMKYQTEERPCVCTKRDKPFYGIQSICDNCNSIFIIKLK